MKYLFFGLKNDGESWELFGNNHTTEGKGFLIVQAVVVISRGGGGNITTMSCTQSIHKYEHIISLENLLEAWKEFASDKKRRADVQWFGRNLVGHIITLHQELQGKTYRHSKYHAFKINDPKPRDIHKAKVRDRLLHHAIYRLLYPFFDRTFNTDSFSCRRGKGTHRALNRFRNLSYKVSENHTCHCYVLKCDIRKFFASINHDRLLLILASYIPDKDILWLLKEIIDSFHTAKWGTGLPLGNLTSQLLVNVYMNEFDQFIKHRLKVKHYIRYADDFAILSDSKEQLENLLPKISSFLQADLYLQLHPDKVSIRNLASGVDFLGWVHLTNHRVLRTVTKRRMLKRIKVNPKPEMVQSYMGMLSHGNTYKLIEKYLIPSNTL